MNRILQIIAAATLLLTLIHLSSTAAAQGTAFTYQGQLQNSGSPASGTYNLTFSLFNTNTGGVAIAGPVTNSAVAVTNGLFTVQVDFGSSPFTGQTNWLEIGVETNGANSFATLAPRQQVTPTPYAITAESINGSLPASQLTSVGNNNFYIGPSGNSTTTGSYNTANGVDALFDNTTGSNNTANGESALYNNTTGSQNTANGVDALFDNTIGRANTANGYEALYNNTTGRENTANGVDALRDNTTGSFNTANGWSALLSNTNGTYNTANGNDALLSNTTGAENTANGAGALYLNTTGSNNTANGFEALVENTSGNDNTADGYNALGQVGSNGAGGTNNIAVGYLAGANYTDNESSNIDIGNEGVQGENNVIRIGTQQSATYLAGTVYASGAVFNAGVDVVSDRNAKENFAPVNPQAVLAKVTSLPVTEWNYKTDKNLEHMGPMAQDFHAAFGLNGADDKHISVVDEGGVALAAIQGLNEKVDEKDAEIAGLKKQNDSLAERLNELEAEVKLLAKNNH